MIIAVTIWSCAERTVCPAYQSAFIHDKDALVKRFSYFQEDSTPKILTASKDRFGIAEKVPYWKKNRSLNTVKVETIYPVLDDSLQLAGDLQLQAEMDVVDTVALDSAVFNEIGWEEHFNVEQEFYFHYFNDILVYPEERALQNLVDAQQDKISKDQAGRTQEKKNVWQKFKGIFKKKPKTDEDGSAELVEGEGGTEANTDEEGVDDPPKKKKKFFSFLKKKDKKPKKSKEEKPEEEEKEPTSSEEEEDDDF